MKALRIGSALLLALISMTVSGYSQKVVDRYENHKRYAVNDGGEPVWETGSTAIHFAWGDDVTCYNNTEYIVTFTVEDGDGNVIHEGTLGGPGGVFGSPIPWHARNLCVRSGFADRNGRSLAACLSMYPVGAEPVPMLPSNAIALLVITISIIGAMLIRRRPA